ncbi:glycosyltransferase [Brachybacterium paraconglomeratum]
MIVICTNEVAGPTGYHKSVVQLGNGLSAAGYAVAVLGFLGTGDIASRMLPVWPLDLEVPAYTLRALPADGGRLLHRNAHPELTGDLGALHYEFTANELAALRELNDALTEEDTIVFTAPVQALAFQHALGGDARRPRTVLQIHGDYLHHAELWDPLMATRDVIDRLQTVADGLRQQFIPTFADEDVVFIPNFPGEGPGAIQRVEHEGVNIALPASFQHRKNQLDAVRALSLIEDESVHLTLWGNINRNNPYYVAVRELVDSLDLGGRVHMPGFGTEHDVYSTADIVLMSSLSEGFPYPLLEAMYQGRPTVSYDFDFGPREAIEDGASGYIVPLGDVEQLAARLGEVAADAALRERFGRRARERYDERFAPSAVVEQYREFFGPHDAPLDLANVFATDGKEPIGTEEIEHRARRTRGGRLHQLTVTSLVGLHDVQVDDGLQTRAAKVRTQRGTTRIEFEASAPVVISYTTAPGSGDRHYLASTTAQHELVVLAHLRRDARYGAGRPAAQDAIFGTSGGTLPLHAPTALAHLAMRAPRDVVWKARDVATTVGTRMRARRELAGAEGATLSQPSANPTEGEAPLGQSADLDLEDETSAGGTVDARSILTPLLDIGPSAAASTMRILSGLSRAPAAPTRREIPRHPWYPVTAGVDSFGTPINQTGGVQVRNAGTAERPTVSVRGEYDWVELRDGASRRRVSPPWSYGEMFERLCEAERKHGLFEITTADDVHLWELGRSALVIQLAEAAGFWGAAPAVGGDVRDEYLGSKRLSKAPRADRVVFDYARRGQSGYRTAPFVDDESLFVVQPGADGYPDVDETNMVYPFAEFTQWKKDWRRRWSHLRVPEVDARPFEAALSEALGIRVDLGDHLRNRLVKFLAEREFFTPVFERVQPEEVLIASSHWWAGIAAAASRSGARVSDIQYALTSHYAPSFWFGQKPRYGATRFYAWSDFWAERTNVYDEHVVVPRQQEELTAAIESPSTVEKRWDVCVVSQPRVLRRILAFVQELVRERPEMRVVIAPHPAQRTIIGRELAAAGLEEAVDIAEEDTLTTITRSAMAVGTFSTSLWESAALGCPTFVIPVPGHEETLQDVESDLFRLATSPHDLVPYEVPASRHDIFGTA